MHWAGARELEEETGSCIRFLATEPVWALTGFSTPALGSLLAPLSRGSFSS